jgi:hypothetical protein
MNYETITRDGPGYEQRHTGFITAVGSRHVARSADIQRLPSYAKSYDDTFLQGYATLFRR